MKRRSILYAMLGATPAANSLLGWQSAGDAAIPSSVGEAVALGLPRFFTKGEFAAFAELGEILIPAFDGRPGAKEAEAPEFLDFLLGQSPADLQALYKSGVNVWMQRKKTGPDAALKELTAPWSHAGPDSAYAKFLAASKLAFHQATVNSREWAEAMSQRSRAAAGIGSYWLPVE